MRLSELLWHEVVSESGWSYGRVFDVRLRISDEGAELTGLVVGPAALRERLFGGRVGEPGEISHGNPVVPWEAVLRLSRGTIVVRDDADMLETREQERPAPQEYRPGERGGEQ